MLDLTSLLGRYRRLRPEIDRIREVVAVWSEELGVSIDLDKVSARGGVVDLGLHPAKRMKLRGSYQKLLEQIRAQGVSVQKIL